jgi:flagellar protein FliO/FliZ
MESSEYIRFAAALMFVLALMGAAVLALRASGFLPQMGRARRGPGRRLALVETLMLDPKRRLALIARDGVEHLIVLGPQGETVVEAGIKTPEARGAEPEIGPDLAGLGGLRAERWS